MKKRDIAFLLLLTFCLVTTVLLSMTNSLRQKLLPRKQKKLLNIMADTRKNRLELCLIHY